MRDLDLVASIIDIKSYTVVQPLYEDSTHRLWQLDTSRGKMMLKVCDADRLQQSYFWQGMESLFGLHLTAQLGQFSAIYDLVSELSPLAIPRLKYAASKLQKEPQDAFLLSEFLAGVTVFADHVNETMVHNLADHLACLHQRESDHWGALISDQVAAKEWPLRLQKTLFHLADRQGLKDPYITDLIAQASRCQPSCFVPIMPDLRWDQFLQQQGQLSALVDLDAFVYGPKELDFVLLEYLLNDQQCHWFADTYRKKHLVIPDLAEVRKPYRLLLFLMQVLAEKDLQKWMSVPSRFESHLTDQKFSSNG